MRNREGFTIIELLTVIAIIGVLAALIFPVVASSRESAKKAQCTNNMLQIYTAIKQFQLDEKRYPDFIVSPVCYDSSGVVRPLEKTSGEDATGQAVAIFPEYIKEPSSLRCPRSGLNADGNRDYAISPADDKAPDVVDDPLGRQWYAADYDNDPNNPELRPVKLYAYSSYDYQYPRGNQPNVREVHYALSWTNNTSHPKFDRQLKWRNPPPETVVTWCAFHRDMTRSGPKSGSRDLVLFLDGHVKQLSSALAFNNNWRNAWANFSP